VEPKWVRLAMMVACLRGPGVEPRAYGLRGAVTGCFYCSPGRVPWYRVERFGGRVPSAEPAERSVYFDVMEIP
jgi:hypothetical protein